MVRVAAEQLSDSPGLPVGETEGAVDRLIGCFEARAKALYGEAAAAAQ